MEKDKKFLTGFMAGVATMLLIAILATTIYLITARDKEAEKDNSSSQVSSQLPKENDKDASQTTGSSELVVGTGLPDADPEKEAIFVKKYNYIMTMIKYYYLNGIVDEDAIYDGILDGLVKGLGDPYSDYFNSEEYSVFLESMSSTYAGIGVLMSQNMTTGAITVIQPFRNSPAEKAGMKPGDILYSVDGENVADYVVDYVVAKVKGEEGTSVDIEVMRGDEIIKMTIVRQTITIENVMSKMLDDNIGYITMMEFMEDTASQMETEIDKLIAQGAERLVIDMRDNPGGLVDEALSCLELFIDEGELLLTIEDKTGAREDYYSEKSAKYDIPVIILQNGNSASASEIFAGAMQCLGRAELIGEKSFGKGIVQQLYPINVDKSGLKITVFRYLLPNGICIHGEGIEPDIKVELDPDLKRTAILLREHDNQIDAAVEAVKKINK